MGNKSNIPVLIPPGPVLSQPSSSLNSSMVTFTKSSSTSQPHPLHGVTLKAMGQPNVIPSGAGFPPRSLHAYIPGSAASSSMSVGMGAARHLVG